MKYLMLFFLLSFSLFSQKNIIDKNDFKQGYWELYFPRTDSLVSEKGFFVDDKENGLWTKFHDSGIVREVVSYKNGLIEGVRVVIDKKGKLKEQENYLSNKLHGFQKYFHDTGKNKNRS